jgi:hypothetical protein
MVNMISTEHQ